MDEKAVEEEAVVFNALSPHDFEIVQSVFKSLAQAAWFDRTNSNEQACAKFVLVQYGEGGLEVGELLARCEDGAMERFGRRH